MKKFNSLKFRLVLLMVAIIFFFSLILFVYMRVVVKNEIEDETYEAVYANQKEVDNNLISTLGKITSMYFSIVNNVDFYEEDFYTNYNEEVTNLTKNDSTIDVALWFKNEYYFQNEKINFNNQYFINTILEKSTSTNMVFGSITIDSEGTPYILFGKKVLKYNDNNICLIFCVKEEKINSYLNTIAGDLGYSVITSNNQIISHPNKDMIGTIYNNVDQNQTIDGIDMIALDNELETINSTYKFSWKVITFLDREKLFKAVDQFIFYDSLIITISVILGIILALIISSWLVTPINKLIVKLKEFSKTGKKSDEEPLFSDDIAELDRAFEELMVRISNLIETNNIEQENKRELELYALQVQINPHFLYNTLDAIAWMAKLKKQPEIEKLVLALAQFFRISLHKGDKIITVEEELDLIRNYCIIELTKVPDSFDITYEISDDVLKLNTMKLILQPIVENSIKHGIATREEKGHIIVKAYNDDKYIYYEVIDDGEGFQVPKDMLEHEDIKVTSGYGLKNVDERIKLEYGNDCGISIESQIGKGTKVTVRFKNRE